MFIDIYQITYKKFVNILALGIIIFAHVACEYVHIGHP